MSVAGRRGAQLRARALHPLLALACLLLLPAGCGRCGAGGQEGDASSTAPSTPVAVVAGEGLVPVPLPDLSTADPAVLRQIEELQAEIDRLRAERESPAADGADAELAEAYGNLAKALMSYQLAEAADAAMINAHRLAPGELSWAYLLGYLRFLRGDPEAAEALLLHALEIDPDYLPTLVRLGDLELAEGNEAAARRYFERAMEVDGAEAAVHAGLGRAASGRGDHAAAVEHFSRALELQEDASSVHYLLGQALRRVGEVEKAQFHLARAGDGPVQVTDPLLLEISGLAESFQFYAIQGAEAAADGRWDQAANAFQRALEIDPSAYTAHHSLSIVLSRLGDSAGAEEELRRALELVLEEHGAKSPETVEISSSLTNLLLSQGRDEEALPHLQRTLRALTDDSERAARRLVLADTYARLGRLDEALAEYDRVLSAPGGDTAATRVRRATVLINLGRLDEALAEFRRAVDRSPDSAGVRLRYAEALDFVGRPSEAEAQRRRARELAATGEEKVARLAGEGRLAASRGDLEEAASRYREALAEDPTRHEVRMALASVLARRGDPEAALGEYRRIVEAEPEHSNARRRLVSALILLGRYGHARVELNEALRRSPRDLGLALTQIRLLSAAPDPRVRDGALALRVARKVEEVNQGLLARDSLAMALAEAGEVAEAARVQQGVVDEAAGAGLPEEVRREMAERLAAYRAGRSWQADDPRQLVALGGGGAGP